MSPGGLFAGTGPDGGDGPSRRPGGRKGPGDRHLCDRRRPERGSAHSLGFDA